MVPNLLRAAFLDEIDEAAADTFHRRNLELVGPDRLHETGDRELLGARQGGRHVRYLQAERANRRAVHGVEAVSEPFGLAVHDDVDVALLPTRDGLAAVLRYRHEAERREHAPERLRFLVAGRELDELHAFDVDARRHRGLDRRARP